jgi:eukaryotic-like serine/threonine-protein kinase
MNADRWNKIKELFSSAQGLADNERAEFLRGACGGDAGLQTEVENLLESHSDDSFLEESAAADAGDLLTSELTDAGRVYVSADTPQRLTPGTTLNDRYQIVRLLGRGGMGEVYLAVDSRINRNVALKLLHPDLVSNKESLRRFALEAQAVSALNHPHIMTIHDFQTADEGTVFIVAEYVDGRTLNNLIGEIDVDKALEISIQVASALAAAHEAGITHRDVKPENIMVRRDGYIKVLDFGLAKLSQQGALSTSSDSDSDAPTQALPRTKPGMIMGTAAYMSPEQARGLRVDARTDVWSLGAVMYEMLTGRRPFTGETQADIIVSVLLTDPPPVSNRRADLPAELEAIVSKALSKDVEIRYQSVEEMRGDIENVRKRIQYDDSFARSFDSGARSRDAREEATIISTAENVVQTAGGAARPTDGAGTEALPSFQRLWSLTSTTGTSRTRSPVGLALVVVVLIALGGYFAFIAPASSQQIDSIAVLPFSNLSTDPELAYLSDGLSEALIDRLAALPQLKVISRSSSFKFRGADLDLGSVASQLGVRAIVTGSVSQKGDDLTIRIDITDTVDNRQLGGGQFRRKTGDIVSIQNEIARAAVEQLRLKLSDSQSRRIANRATENSEAYRYYLSGLVELNSPLFVRSKALDYFERAVKLDPDYAAAYAEMAWVYYSQAMANGDPHELMPEAKAAAERALTLDPDLAKAHVVQAMVKENEFDWTGAENEYKLAIELSPNLDFARNNYSFFLSVTGRLDEALAELEELRIRDPINQRLLLLYKGFILTQARRFDEALQVYQEAQALEPEKEIPNMSLAYAYAGKGSYNEAVGYYRRSVEMLGGEEKYSQPLVYLAATYAKMPGKEGEARAILNRIETAHRYFSPALVAAVYTALGENDRAIELLEQAYTKRDPLLRFIKTGYEYDGLRQDPRFIDLTIRMGFGE